MKNNWQTKKIGEVCEIVNGGTPDTKVVEYWNGEHLWITPKDMGKLDGIYVDNTERKISGAGLKNSSAKILPVNSVILSSRAPIGHLAINKKEIATNQGCKGIVPKRGLSTFFLFYFLKKSVALLNSLGSGTTFKELSGSKLSEVQIPFPPLPVQHRIVKILDEIFSAIVKAKENSEKNLQNSRELFESYLQSVFVNPGKGWEEKKLGDNNLIRIIDGDRGKNYPAQKDFSDKGFCVFMNTKNVRPNGFDFKVTMFIGEKKDKAMGKGKLKRNDVVMTTRGTIGNLGVYSADVEYDNIRINSGMLIFRPNLKELLPEYLFELLRSGIIKEQIKKHVSGAAQPQLPIKTLVNFTFPVPKLLSEQRSIVDKLNTFSTETKRLEAIYQQKLTDLEELKKTIFQKAFNGELTGACL